jgi:hypothetical protein
MTDITVQDRLEALAILAEIRMSRIEKQQAEIDRLRQQVTQRGARMQVMREWMLDRELNGCDAAIAWWAFVEERPEAAAWFDDDGVPR